VKGAALVLVAFVFLPGSVWMLLAANFGALKGYLISAIAFFGFMIMLSATWAFGLPGTPALTGPVGKEPAFVRFSGDDPVANRYSRVKAFMGNASNGWEAAPAEAEGGGGQLSEADEQLKADLDTAKQAALSEFIAERNKDVRDSSQELDVVNTDTKVFHTAQDGTTLAAVVISPKEPPANSGLRKPTFSPVAVFAYQDPGAPALPSYLFLAGSTLLFLLHVWLLALVERRRPLGAVLTPQAEQRTTATRV
jgi:hypothetical protein